MGENNRTVSDKGEIKVYVGTIEIKSRDQGVYPAIKQTLPNIGIDMEIKDKMKHGDMYNFEKCKIKMFRKINS